jgi:hypothetical protein
MNCHGVSLSQDRCTYLSYNRGNVRVRMSDVDMFSQTDANSGEEGSTQVCKRLRQTGGQSCGVVCRQADSGYAHHIFSQGSVDPLFSL